jgi:cobyrinic acid a,c-diamide synthase
MVAKYLDVEQVWDIAHNAPVIDFDLEEHFESVDKEINIGIVRDPAFQFYYPENIDALKRAGARLMEFSALTDDLPPALDALYIGGGFPETHAASLAANKRLRIGIRKAAAEGLPIYAECGGLMYLGEKLIWEEKEYPMVGVFPIVVGVSKKPKGHGYTIAEVQTDNPYFRKGEILHGHEFHYSYVMSMAEKKGVYFSFKMNKGGGIMDGKDGLCYKNVLATYTHLHAFGSKTWSDGLMRVAEIHKTTEFIC